MRSRAYIWLAAFIIFLTLEIGVQADTHGTFQTTRYYSSNNLYFVTVTPNKRATLYRKGKRRQRVWSVILPELPAHLFIRDDGKRVVMIDHYYGNNHSATAKVILFFDEHGNQIANYSLGEVAHLPRVFLTISSAHWYYGAFFSSDQSTLFVETIVRKCEPPAQDVQSQADIKAMQECMKAQPYEELRFSMAHGKLISRVDIQLKYDDPEKRLLHELELAESEYPSHNLDVANALLELAHLYEGQSQNAKAASFYERAILVYSKALGQDYSGVAEAVGEAATNYRKLGDFRRAERFYQQALASLDKNQDNPGSAYHAAIKIYEEYAFLLRKLHRKTEAKRMEARAKVIRSVYADNKN